MNIEQFISLRYVKSVLFFFIFLLLGYPNLGAEDFSYMINSNSITITGYSGTNHVVNIPDFIDDLPVTRIGEYAFEVSDIHSVYISSNVVDIGHDAFYACDSLTNVVMHIGVTNIGDWAFANCDALFEMNIPDSVLALGEHAFSGCQNLSAFDFGNGLVSLGQETFYACTNLTKVLLPSTLREIGDMAFRYCKDLTSIVVAAESPFFCSTNGVVLSKDQSVLELFPPGRGGVYVMPDTIQTIGDFSFINCQLAGVNFPNGVTNIEEQAFYNCWNLCSVKIPGSVKYVGLAAFTYCVGLTNLVLSEGLNEIGEWAFAECKQLPDVKLPQSLEKIGANAFCECTGLTSIFIPENVLTIGTRAFSGCSKLSSISVDTENLNFSAQDGVLFNKDGTLLICCPGGFLAKDYAVPKGTVTIESRGIYECTNLFSVSIPDSVTNVMGAAFYGCSNLETISVGQNVAMLDFFAFANCTRLKEVYFHGDRPAGNSPVFDSPSDAMVYYQAGTAGWSNSFDSVPAVLWNPRIGSQCEINANGFGFPIIGDADYSIVVEASTNLTLQTWERVFTNTLNEGEIVFHDSQWSTFPTRFYRLQMP